MNKKILAAIKMLYLSLALVFVLMIFRREEKKDNEGQNIYVSPSGECSIVDYSMGTSVNIKVYGKGAEDCAVKLNECIAGLEGHVLTLDIDKLLAAYKVGEPVAVSDELYDLINDSLAICMDSKGALDITIEPLNELWGIDKKYGKEFNIPDNNAIMDTLSLVGYEHVKTASADSDYKYIVFDRENIKLSIGAVGKGYALDRVRDILKADGAEGACVAIGGSVLVYGTKPDKEAFIVGIRNPKSESADDMIGRLVFYGNVNVCVSTSGDYEKYIEKDGVRYHHIFDRATGYPADSGLSSVTVVCESGIFSDGLSTACFVMGYEKSLPLIEKYNAEAVFIDKAGNVTVTDGLKDIYESVD